MIPLPEERLIKWGDAAQYHAEAQVGYQGEHVGVMPSVHLLWMTPDPLGAVAAMAQMYKGNVVRSLKEVDDDMRRSAFEDVQQTHLKAPLEAVKLHFLIEGVDRAFTHQHVRQRTAVYAQESLRFAVPGDLSSSTTLPPSLQGTEDLRHEGDPGMTQLWDDAQWWRNEWEEAIETIDRVYHRLVDSGMPAEEARGLLPHCTATRLHYVTDLRNLSDHAGNRLCTQAQFHWRYVFSRIIQAIRHYVPDFEWADSSVRTRAEAWWDISRSWQFEAIASSSLFRPVCYQLNYCPFQASFDRTCTIRERVSAFHGGGVPSRYWSGDEEDHVFTRADGESFDGIKVEEWLLNPAAARSSS